MIWIYGLAGSGKTTLAKALYPVLLRSRPRLILLDGEDVRWVFPSLGYDELDRLEMGETKCRLAALLIKQGCDIIMTGVSWRPSDVLMVPEYFDVFLDIPVSMCASRNPLYAGTDRNVLGVDLPYRRPVNPKLTITEEDQVKGVQYCVDLVCVALSSEKPWAV